MQKTWKSALGLGLCACLLAGCGAPIAEAGMPSEPETSADAEVQPETVFLSTDGSMEYTMDLQVLPEDSQLTPVPITPYFFTGEDVRALCTAVLGDGEYYEQEPSVGGKYSREELEAAAALLETYLDRETMAEMAGAGSPLIGMLSDYQNLLEGTRKRIPQGTEENPHQVCDWTFKAFNHYKNSDWDAKTDDLALMAEAERSDVRYSITAILREDMPYLSSLSIQYGTMLPEFQLMRAIYDSRLCRTAPTEDQVRQARKKAQETLEAFQPGKWAVESVRVAEENRGEFTNYSIRVRCCPVLDGIPALTDFYEDLPREDGRLYPAAFADFQFAPNGQLLQLFLDSPFTEEPPEGSAAAVLSCRELLEIGKEQLKQYTVYENPGADAHRVSHWEQKAGEPLVGKVQVHTARLCLGRYETEPGRFQYMPVLSLRGHTEFRGKDSGKLYFASDEDGYERSQLVVISAVDGQIIRR